MQQEQPRKAGDMSDVPETAVPLRPSCLGRTIIARCEGGARSAYGEGTGSKEHWEEGKQIATIQRCWRPSRIINPAELWGLFYTGGFGIYTPDSR